jgi:hypothetical protein
MPVNTQGKLYQKNIRRWTVVRDCIDGQEAIHAGGTDYLPKPKGQTKEDYRDYQARAVFFDGTSRTAEGLHGHIFAKDPVQAGEDKLTEAAKEYLKNVDGSGTSLDEYISGSTWDSMQTGFGGHLADHTPVKKGTPVADKENSGRAYIKWYPAESIYSHKYSVINGVWKLTKVVLREDIEEEDPKDEFNIITVEAYRVLSFDAQGYYIQRVFKKCMDDKKLGFIPDGVTIEPEINGKRFDFIPFYTSPGENPEKSMLLGLAYENIGHYQKTAEYENGLFFTSVPTLVVENMETPTKDREVKTTDANGNNIIKKEKITTIMSFGGSTIKFFCQKNQDGDFADVRVKYVEFTGAGIGEILKALNACLDRMAKLGIQAIGSEKKGVETTEVAQLHRAAENGVLGAFARSSSNRATEAVRLMLKWNLPNENVEAWSYQLNTDFDYKGLSAQILTIMYNARQSNEIPRSIWFAVLKKHGIVPEEMTLDEFIQKLNIDYTYGHGPDVDGV